MIQNSDAKWTYQLFHVNDWQWGLAIFHNKQVIAVLSSLKIWHIGALL
jgi:hypothetical protein